jgi:hypothetical protein
VVPLAPISPKPIGNACKLSESVTVREIPRAFLFVNGVSMTGRAYQDLPE